MPRKNKPVYSSASAAAAASNASARQQKKSSTMLPYQLDVLIANMAAGHIWILNEVERRFACNEQKGAVTLYMSSKIDEDYTSWRSMLMLMHMIERRYLRDFTLSCPDRLATSTRSPQLRMLMECYACTDRRRRYNMPELVHTENIKTLNDKLMWNLMHSFNYIDAAPTDKAKYNMIFKCLNRQLIMLERNKSPTNIVGMHAICMTMADAEHELDTSKYKIVHLGKSTKCSVEIKERNELNYISRNNVSNGNTNDISLNDVNYYSKDTSSCCKFASTSFEAQASVGVAFVDRNASIDPEKLLSLALERPPIRPPATPPPSPVTPNSSTPTTTPTTSPSKTTTSPRAAFAQRLEPSLETQAAMKSAENALELVRETVNLYNNPIDRVADAAADTANTKKSGKKATSKTKLKIKNCCCYKIQEAKEAADKVVNVITTLVSAESKIDKFGDSVLTDLIDNDLPDYIIENARKCVNAKQMVHEATAIVRLQIENHFTEAIDLSNW